MSFSKRYTFRLGRGLIALLMLVCPFFVVQSWRHQHESLTKDARLRAAFQQEWQNLLTEVLWRRFVTDRGGRAALLTRERPDDPLVGVPEFLSLDAFERLLGAERAEQSSVPDELQRLLWSDALYPSGLPQCYAGFVEILREAGPRLSEADLVRMHQVGAGLASAERLPRRFMTLLLDRLPSAWHEVYGLQRRFCALSGPDDGDGFYVFFRHEGREVFDRYAAAEIGQINRALRALNLDLALEADGYWAQYENLWLTLKPRSLPADEQLQAARNIHLFIFLFVEVILLVIYLLVDQYDKIHRFQQQLLAATSHELRTPLAVIRQFAELLEKKRDQFPARVQTYHQFVLRESIKMQFMVENLLQTARFEHLRLRPKPTAFALAPWLAECVEGARRLDGEWQVTVEALPEQEVFWDAAMMGQVVMNLLDNARVHAKTRVAVAATVPEAGCVRLTIRDYGEAVDVAAVRRVQAFKRSDQPETGLGLGLYLCSTIVKGHGGSMDFEAATPGLRVVLDVPARVSEG